MESVRHEDRLAEIDSWLPQTQCTKCGYPRCGEYAEAIADGRADINQCPPGGDTTIRGLAAVTGTIGKPLDPVFGLHEARTLAKIDEAICIGCVMCIKACPVDAIIGAAKLMHTVVPNLCTGCGLCIEPCPVDCISMGAMTPQAPGPDWRWTEYSPEQTSAARKATQARLTRIAIRAEARSSEKRLRELRRAQGREHIRQEIRAAVDRKHAGKKNKRSET